MVTKDDLSDRATGAAKQLAPWKTSLPWWVVLVEGLIVAGVGLMVVLDPQGTNANLALVLSVGLAIAGATQLWDVFRHQVPEKVDSLVAARAGIAVYAGVALVVLSFIEGALTRVSGFGIFGTAALVYGILALVQALSTEGGWRRQPFIEFLLFTSVGALAIYGLYSGAESIVTAVRIIGWIFLIGGIALIALAVYRWQKGEEADQKIEAITGSVASAADSVTSFGRTDKPAETTAQKVEKPAAVPEPKAPPPTEPEAPGDGEPVGE